MIEHPSIIPITVVAAATIFLIKEILEAIRRYQASKRRLHGLKMLLAGECERNKWTTNWLKIRLPNLLEAFEQGRQVSIVVTSTGVQRLKIESGKGSASSPVPKVHVDIISKYLFEAATLSARLFACMEATAVSLAELIHLRDGLLENVSEDQQWLDGWTQYAEEELADVEKQLAELYRLCTGRNLEKFRLR